MIRYLFVVCLALSSLVSQAQTLSKNPSESISQIEVSTSDMYGREETRKVVITEFRPRGKGPFPVVVLNHGRATGDRALPPRFRLLNEARFFTEHGFVVFVPTRIGYGELGTDFDPENSGACKNKKFAPGAEAASKEILAVLDHARQLPEADTRRVLMVGQSYGGYSVTAIAARNPPGVLAAINFAGGAGGQPEINPGIPCQGFQLEAMYAKFGETAKVPMLWIYTENDQYFLPVYTKAWHAAFVKAGGNAEYHLMPPFGENGHYLFSRGHELWAPVVNQFLLERGLIKAQPQPVVTAPVDPLSPD